METEILYIDRDVIVCKKPAGVPSQPDPSGQKDLFSALSAEYGELSLVHRLDTPTGGAMVFARGKKAAAGLSRLVQEHEKFVKEYLAVLPSPPKESEGKLCDFVFHDKRVNKAFITDKARKGSKEASLSYRVLETRADGRTLVVAHAGTCELSIIDRAALHDRLAKAAKGESASGIVKSAEGVNHLVNITVISRLVQFSSEERKKLDESIT